LNALKLLSEMASESENEVALEVVHVQSLSMVGTFYSPLIFDLKQGSSHEQLVKRFTLVNQNLDKNPRSGREDPKLTIMKRSVSAGSTECYFD